MAWQRVRLVVPGRHAQPLAEALEAAGAVSTDLADADAGTPDEDAVFAEPGAESALWTRCVLTALFPEDADAQSLVDAAVSECGADAPLELALDRLADADWVAETQRQFDPIRVGDRVWIVPTWHAPPDPEGINILLDPGAAFGTGSHPTTRLVLGWLEREVRAGDSVLDYGCGSGILAIAALKLGAGHATGVDIDPLALEAAGYNARANGVALTLAGANGELPSTFRITVANILANPLRMLAPLLSAHTAAGGRIALSGILASQADEVIEAYAPWCDLAVQGDEDGWMLVAGTRRVPC